LSTRAPLRAITFDYWDTLYDGAALPERATFRQTALRRLLVDIGHKIDDDAHFLELYRSSGVEADRWWREEHRGYTARDRISWMLERLSITRPDDCEHVARAVDAVDEALVTMPPPLLDGAAECIRAVADRYRLGIISDTGFASGHAQNRLLERDGIREYFATTVYSADLGHAKPRPEPFIAALKTLGVRPEEALHVGDNERTDVRGALAAGMRAVRIDVTREGGETAGEFVARSLPELSRYLLALETVQP
jgi:putative hydrolase of the HAD superfamily